MVQRVFTYIWYNLVHATNAWKKDKELNVQACRILKHLWFVGRQEQSRCRRRNPVRYNSILRDMYFIQSTEKYEYYSTLSIRAI